MAFLRIETVDAVHGPVIVEALEAAGVRVRLVPISEAESNQALQMLARPRVDVEVEEEDVDKALEAMHELAEEGEEAAAAEALSYPPPDDAEGSAIGRAWHRVRTALRKDETKKDGGNDGSRS